MHMLSVNTDIQAALLTIEMSVSLSSIHLLVTASLQFYTSLKKGIYENNDRYFFPDGNTGFGS